MERRQRTKRTIPVPAASSRTHLLAAGVLWTTVGLGLLLAGALWILRCPAPRAYPVLFGAGLLGWLKARLVLNRIADRMVRRIGERGDGRCLGGFLSWKSWLLVLAMLLLGRWLRTSPLASLWRGLIYAAVGAGLFLATRRIWAAYRRQVAEPPA